MARWRSNKLRGQSVIEVMIATGIFMLLASGTLILVTESLASAAEAGNRVAASGLVTQGLEAVRSIKENRWTDVTMGVHGLAQDGSNVWLFSGAQDVISGFFTRAVNITPVNRDAGGTIVTSGGTIDPRTKKASVTVSWNGGIIPIQRSITRSVYLTDWATYDWTQTTDTDFGLGTMTFTTASGTGTAATVTLSNASKTWDSEGGTNIIHTTDTDWNSGTHATTQALDTGTASYVQQTPTLAWSAYSQPLTFYETTDADFITGDFSGATTAVADTGDLGAVVLNTTTDWALTLPTPSADNLTAVSAFSTTDAWAVGAAGRIIRWNGTSWSTVTSPTAVQLNGVAGTSSATNTWAVGNVIGGNGVVVRWNGTTWASTPPSPAVNQNLLAVSMLTPSYGWAGADAGSLLRWNGVTWTQSVDTGVQVYTGIQVNSATSAWAVTANTSGASATRGQIWHYNGTTWTNASVTSSSRLFSGITCVTSTFCWAVDTSGGIWRYNAANWPTINGANWILQQTATGPLRSVKCASASSCTAVGDGGIIYHYSGTMPWVSQTSPTGTGLKGVVMVSSRRFGVGDGGVLVDYGQHYLANGIYYSNALDAGSTQNWGNISWEEALGVSNTLQISTRSGPITCSGATACAGWSAWTAAYTPSTGVQILSPAAQFIQYRATFATTDRATTGRLNSITIAYNSAPAQDNYDLTMLSTNDGWGVGAGGGIARWDGVAWSAFTSPSTAGLYGVGGVATNDLWAVGLSANILRYNGTSWSLLSSGAATTWHIDVECLTTINCRMVGGDFATAPYAVIINRWDGVSWTADTGIAGMTGWMEAIRYVSATDIWAAGSAGRVLRNNGSGWSLFATYGTTAWHGMWMISGTDGWLVGDGGNIRRWNGSAWNAVASPTSNILQDVECVSATLCWAVGDGGTILKWDGVSWALQASPTVENIESVAQDGTDHAWAVAHNTGFLEYRATYSSTATWTSPIVDGGSSGTVWNSLAWDEIIPATTDITIATRTGPNPTCCTGWSAYSSELTNPGNSTIPSPANRYFQYRVTFTSGNLVSTGVLQEVRIVKDALTTQPLYGVEGTGVNDVWVVGENGFIGHYDGTAWLSSTSPVATTLRDVDTISPSSAYAVGFSGRILRWNGTAWSIATSPTSEELHAVDIRTPSEGWAVGTNGALVRFNGTNWTNATSTPTASALYGVSLISATDGLAVGAGGVGVRWNGTSWSTVATGTSNALNALNCLDSTHCWAVGDAGTIRFWNGTAWSATSSPVVSRLNAVEWRSSTEAWAVGDFGAILTYDGISWSSYTSPSTRDMYDLSVYAPTDGWIAGNGGEILKDPIVYRASGTFLSSVLDMDATSSEPLVAYWHQTTPVQTTLTLTMRAGNVAVPDGTWTGFAPAFTVSDGEQILLGTKRYLQYKVTMSTSDTSITPSFEDITVTYR